MRRSNLRRQSSKKQKENRQRRKLAQELLIERGDFCEARTVDCEGKWVDMHEVLLRSQGGSAVDKENILCVCRSCHIWIHSHPKSAREKGLIRSEQVHQ